MLSAGILTTLQRCPRRLRIEETEGKGRWNPKALFESILRKSVFALANGENKEKVVPEACTQFLETAARPGLDCLTNPYVIAQDFCAILQTCLESVSRSPTVACVHPRTLTMPNGMEWGLAASRSRESVLYRWTSVATLDDDTLTSELHSWYTFGDVAAAQMPMVLNIVEIGYRRGGHQHTPWCKTFRHPAVIGRFAFQQKDGRKLNGDWKPVWYQDGDQDPKAWVDLMERDRVNLIHQIHVKVPTEAQIADFHRQVAVEQARLQALPADWHEIPMFRPACDRPHQCPQQLRCYR